MTDQNGSPDSALHTLEDVPGKGKGLIASQFIRRGTLIISEAPLFTTEGLQDPATIEKDLGKIVRGLPKDGVRAFLSLHNNNPGSEPFSNIIRSNGYPLGPESDIGGIFPLVARINHSCRPNAQHAWNDKQQKMLVHAVRDIAAGDEFTLSYIAGGPSNVRKSNIKTYFGFDCACELCSLPAAEQKVSDQHLEKAQQLDQAIGDARRVRYRPEQALADCHELLEIYKKEQIMDLRIPRLYYDALQICGMHSDQARVSAFAQLSGESRRLCEGQESSEAASLDKLVTKPSTFENFGVTKNWQSRVEDKPKDTSDDQKFDLWIWRAKP